MTLPLLSLLIVISLIAFVVVYHAKNPDAIYLIVAREWQTLIGALLGFWAISFTILLESSFDKKEAQRTRISADIAYLSSFKKELEIISQDQYSLSPILGNSDFLDSPRQCKTFFDLHSVYTNWNFSLERNFSNIINDVSPEVYVLMTDTLAIKKRFIDNLNSINLDECIQNTKGVYEAIKSTHDTFGELLENQHSAIKSHLETIN